MGAKSIETYLGALESFSVAELAAAVDRILSPDGPEQWRTFAPSAPELANYTKLFRSAEESAPLINVKDVPEGWRLTVNRRGITAPIGTPLPPGWTTSGGTVNFGYGSIDLSPLSDAERDFVMNNHGILPDGRNMAFLPTPELRAAIANPDLLDAAPRRTLPLARLQRV